VAVPPGLASPPRHGLVALVVVALGSTTFDGLSRTGWWVDSTASFIGWQRTLVFTLGLLSTCVIVTGIYAVAMTAGARVVGGEWQPLARTFAHSLVPIALAYVVAHYFSFLLIEGQIGLSRLSDPFGRGWDLIGTAGWQVNLTLLSPTVVWYVQVFAIVAGHVAGVMVAHDRAIARYERVGRSDAVRVARGDDPVHRGRPADPVGMSDAGRSGRGRPVALPAWGRPQHRGNQGGEDHQRHGGAHDPPAGPPRHPPEASIAQAGHPDPSEHHRAEEEELRDQLVGLAAVGEHGHGPDCRLGSPGDRGGDEG
jgi:hypothetical protein